jgi:hypothetical protein
VDYVNNATTALQLLQVIVRIILKPTILIIKLNSKEGHSLELEANYNENDDPEMQFTEFKQRQ